MRDSKGARFDSNSPRSPQHEQANESEERKASVGAKKKVFIAKPAKKKTRSTGRITAPLRHSELNIKEQLRSTSRDQPEKKGVLKTHKRRESSQISGSS